MKTKTKELHTKTYETILTEEDIREILVEHVAKELDISITDSNIGYKIYLRNKNSEAVVILTEDLL